MNFKPTFVYWLLIIRSGLDPALPFFATARQNWKLDPTDGWEAQQSLTNHLTSKFDFSRDFIDVIHTNAGIYGKLESCGTVDFYMNNGQFQVITNQSASLR